MDTAAIIKALEANLWAQASYLAGSRKDAVVQDTADFLLVDSGLPCAEFNVIGRSSLHPRFGVDRIESAMNHFRAKKSPFTWWTGPLSGQATLGPVLAEMGLTRTEEKLGMALALDTAKLPSVEPAGFEIKRAAGKDGIKDFATLMSASQTPADENIAKFYEDTTEAALASGSPTKLYVGYVGGGAAAVLEAFYSSGAVGLYRSATAASARGKGYVPALMIAALKDAKKAGIRLATVLAAGAEATGLQRLGFKPVSKFASFTAPAA